MASGSRTKTRKAAAQRKPRTGQRRARPASGAAGSQASLPSPEQEIRDERLERIAARAYDLYQARGGEHGQDVDDWLQAEQEIDAETGEENRED